MKVKKNNYYILTILSFGLVSLIFLYSTSFFSKFINVITFFNGLNSSPSIVLDSDFLNYIKNEQNQINVSKYFLKIKLLYKKKEIESYISIKGTIKNLKTPNLIFNFSDGYDIKYLKLNNCYPRYKYKNDKIIIEAKNIKLDSFNVEIKYCGKPIAKGFGSFVFDKINNKSIIYTLNEPIFASTWMPCNDKPDDKAFFEVKITNTNNFISVSNGILVDTMSFDDLKTYHYKTLYPISTYLISIYSAEYKYYEDYVVCNNDTIRLVYYITNQKNIKKYIDFSPHKKGIQIFSKLFGNYPFIKEKYGIAEISWKYGAIEHQTITGISTNIIKSPDFYESVFVHELAHHWWGDAVGLKSWKDIWLNEGFATYSEALYYEQKAGNKALKSTMNSFVANFEHSTLYNPTTDLFSRLQYFKGAWVLHMLRSELGNELFFKCLRSYYSTYLYKNASTEDFKNICEKVSSKNLDYFFYQWVYKGKGVINLKYHWKQDSSKIFINLKQFNNNVEYHFPLKIKLVQNNNIFNVQSFYIFNCDTTLIINNTDKISEIVLDPENELLIKDIKNN
ncbi:MAG: M1 family metallopeptidase [bacterium]